MIRGIGDPGGECETCPMNAWQSGKNEHGKACKEQRAVFLLRPESLLPCVVSIPPSSLKSFKRYMLGLASAGWKYQRVVTRFALAKAKNQDGIAYAEIRPTLVGAVPHEADEAVGAYAAGMKKALATAR